MASTTALRGAGRGWGEKQWELGLTMPGMKVSSNTEQQHLIGTGAWGQKTGSAPKWLSSKDAKQSLLAKWNRGSEYQASTRWPHGRGAGTMLTAPQVWNLKTKDKAGSERWLHSYDQALLFQRVKAGFLAPALGSSQHVTLAPRDLTGLASTGTCVTCSYPHNHTYRHIYKHLKVSIVSRSKVQLKDHWLAHDMLPSQEFW